MPEGRSRWRPYAARVIGEVIDRVGREDLRALRRAIRAAYPFGRRSGWPYKIWCSEVRRQVDGFTGKKSEVLPGQKGLFSHHDQ